MKTDVSKIATSELEKYGSRYEYRTCYGRACRSVSAVSRRIGLGGRTVPT